MNQWHTLKSLNFLWRFWYILSTTAISVYMCISFSVMWFPVCVCGSQFSCAMSLYYDVVSTVCPFLLFKFSITYNVLPSWRLYTRSLQSMRLYQESCIVSIYRWLTSLYNFQLRPAIVKQIQEWSQDMRELWYNIRLKVKKENNFLMPANN